MDPKAHTRMQRPAFNRVLSGGRPRWRPLAFIVVALVATAIASGVALARSTASRIGNGVVVIKTTLGYQDASAAGTGMVLTSSGEILTNNHVIRGATKITVVVPGTGHAYTASVVGYDVADDVAVLRACRGLEPRDRDDRRVLQGRHRRPGHGRRQRRRHRHAEHGHRLGHRAPAVDRRERRHGRRSAAHRPRRGQRQRRRRRLRRPAAQQRRRRDRDEHRRLDRVRVPLLLGHPGLRDSDRQGTLDRPPDRGRARVDADPHRSDVVPRHPGRIHAPQRRLHVPGRRDRRRPARQPGRIGRALPGRRDHGDRRPRDLLVELDHRGDAREEAGHQGDDPADGSLRRGRARRP